MPELPEVETVRRDLAGVLPGRTITRVEATGARTVRRYGAEALVAGVAGRAVVALRRHGKHLLVDLDDGGVVVVHLRMSGQVRLAGAGEPRAPHTHVVLSLDDGRELRFVDPRTFGEVFATSSQAPELAALGPDALEPGVGPGDLARLLAGRRAPVKAVLLDQRRLAGLGNIYADEVLHRAGVRPTRPAGAVGRAGVHRLAAAIPEVLEAAVVARGSSLADAQYVDLLGRPGGFQQLHRVYARAGLPCAACGRPVVRERVAGRSSFSCRRCQR